MIITFSLFAAALITSHALYMASVPVELTRKTAHILGTITALFASMILDYNQFIITATAIILLLAFTQYADLLPSVNNVKRDTYGSILFPIGVLVTYILAGENLLNFQVAILIMGISDCLAAIAGIYIFKATDKKTLGGSAVFFLTTFIILISQLYPFMSLHTITSVLAIVSISYAMTLIERYSSNGVDNIFLPILSLVATLVIF